MVAVKRSSCCTQKLESPTGPTYPITRGCLAAFANWGCLSWVSSTIVGSVFGTWVPLRILLGRYFAFGYLDLKGSGVDGSLPRPLKLHAPCASKLLFKEEGRRHVCVLRPLSRSGQKRAVLLVWSSTNRCRLYWYLQAHTIPFFRVSNIMLTGPTEGNKNQRVWVWYEPTGRTSAAPSWVQWFGPSLDKNSVQDPLLGGCCSHYYKGAVIADRNTKELRLLVPEIPVPVLGL